MYQEQNDCNWLKETQTGYCLSGYGIENKNKKRKRKLVGDHPWRCDGRPKITATIWGELCEGVPHSPRSYEDNTPSSHVRELQQKTRKIILRSVFACLVLRRFISLCVSKTVNSFHTLLLSLQRIRMIGRNQ